MSRENVELVRRAYEAMNSGDLETVLAGFDQDVEFVLAKDAETVLGLDFEESYRGIGGFMQFLARLSEAWEEYRWEPVEYLDAGERVVVFIRMIARGRASGIEIEQDMAHVSEMRNAKVVRHETFFDRAKALEAVGLRE
jgi:ketosteroid isomerase-like protein